MTPPDYAIAEARRTGLDDAGRPLTRQVVRASLGGEKPVGVRSCCQKKAGCCNEPSERTCCQSEATEAADASIDFVLGFRALSCHGQSLNWLAAVPTLILIEFNLADEFPLVAWLGPHFSDIAAGVPDAPTPPPPERA